MNVVLETDEEEDGKTETMKEVETGGKPEESEEESESEELEEEVAEKVAEERVREDVEMEEG